MLYLCGLIICFYMNCKSKFLCFCLLSALFTSCVTQKQMTYFSSVDKSTADSVNMLYKQQFEPRIKVGDALFITVSALSPEAVTMFNLPTITYGLSGGNLVTTPSVQYYTVDQRGDILFPHLGAVHVLGLTRSEVSEHLRQLLSTYVEDPVVTTLMLNPQVTVLGEVTRPGCYVMPEGRLNLLQALGMAGDLTIYGRRDNILVTREVDGKLQFARLNLGTDSVFTSPFYHLQQNDIVYVSPNKVRAISSQNISLWLSMVSTVASAATVIVTVVNSAK